MGDISEKYVRFFLVGFPHISLIVSNHLKVVAFGEPEDFIFTENFQSIMF